MTPTEQLDAVYALPRIVPSKNTYEEVRRLLGEHGVRNLHPEELNGDQGAYLATYVRDNVMPFLSPQIINARHPFPHLENGALYIAVRLNEADAKRRTAPRNPRKRRIWEPRV